MIPFISCIARNFSLSNYNYFCSVSVSEQIIQNGHGYAIEGDVYFSVDSFPEYLLLSGRKLDQNRAGERVAVDTRKRNPADFALWKVILMQ